jgi:hypothetical protein
VPVVLDAAGRRHQARGVRTRISLLPSTEAALVDAIDAIYAQCEEGADAAAAQES